MPGFSRHFFMESLVVLGLAMAALIAFLLRSNSQLNKEQIAKDKKFRELNNQLYKENMELKKENKEHEERKERIFEIVRSEVDRSLQRDFDRLKQREVEVDQRVSDAENEIKKANEKVEQLKEIEAKINESLVDGRDWLCDLISKLEIAKDFRDQYLMVKRNPARTAAETVSQIKEEKRLILKEKLLIEAQLKTYLEYFPWTKSYDQDLLDESILLKAEDDISKKDRTREYLSDEEYKQLDAEERNQLALNRFLSNCSKSYIGMIYELYIGSLYEKQGYKVEYFGITKGLNDEGKDLICKSKSETLIIQAKCWSAKKVVHENTVCQLFGTTIEYKKKHPKENVKAILYIQCALSDRAKEFAKALNVSVFDNFLLRKDFPMIKCNISASGEKIYHLPFDQQYRRTIIDKQGEFMAKTTKEAHRRGFRRAMRHFI